MNNAALALVWIGLLGCGSKEAPMQGPTLDIEQGEIDVAEATIRSWRSRGSRRSLSGQVVIDRLDPYCASMYMTGADGKTPSQQQAESLRASGKDDPLLLEAIEDFLRKRESDIPTALLLDGIDGIDFQSQENASRNVDGQSYWESFRERFPNSYGLGRLSRVGLSDNGQLAIIAHSWIGGFLFGSGKFSVFEKVSGHWELSSREIKGGWIS